MKKKDKKKKFTKKDKPKIQEFTINNDTLTIHKFDGHYTTTNK